MKAPMHAQAIGEDTVLVYGKHKAISCQDLDDGYYNWSFNFISQKGEKMQASI